MQHKLWVFKIPCFSWVLVYLIMLLVVWLKIILQNLSWAFPY
jgi:hypothetical protein